MKKSKSSKIKKATIIADFHIHTIASGHAYSTIQEYAEQAKKIGLKYIAMTDHGPSMPGAPHFYHFANLKMVPAVLNGIRILKGVEANIINEEGKLDLSNETLKNLDFVLFTFHPYCGYENQGEEKNTEVMIKTMQNPYVKAIAHPENSSYPINSRKIVEEAKNKNILIEINNSSYLSRPGSRNKMLEILYYVRQMDALVCLGTDSHISTMVGNFEYGLALCKETKIPQANIINFSENLIKKHITKPE